MGTVLLKQLLWQRQLARLPYVPNAAPIKGADSVVALRVVHGTTNVEWGMAIRGSKDIWSAIAQVRAHVY